MEINRDFSTEETHIHKKVRKERKKKQNSMDNKYFLKCLNPYPLGICKLNDLRSISLQSKWISLRKQLAPKMVRM